LMAKH